MIGQRVSEMRETCGTNAYKWFRWNFFLVLSPGQTDRQGVAGSGKLNLRRDLRWVAQHTGKFPHKNTRVAKKPFQGRHILYFIG